MIFLLLVTTSKALVTRSDALVPSSVFLKGWVPWHPYNFHAGNFFDAKTGYCPQASSAPNVFCFAGLLGLASELHCYPHRQVCC